jgi:hypothetical protein
MSHKSNSVSLLPHLVITKLTFKKEPGTDNIPSEIIKYGGSTLKQRLYNLNLLIWKKGELRKDSMEGIICPIYRVFHDFRA